MTERTERSEGHEGMPNQHSMTERTDAGIIEAARALSAAFAARDLAAALACFVADDDIGYIGSEHAESAAGRAAVARLLATVFARGEAYSWRVTRATVREYGEFAYLLAEADGLVHADDGLTPFPYRISGLVQRVGGRWLWRHCHGCEPAADPLPDKR